MHCKCVSLLLMLIYILTGPPGGITDINITPDTITACGFVVQWSESSSDPVCGTVWYTVTISTEGGILIITDNTTMTNYSVTGLNSSTLYSVNVTASNNAGSSVPTGTSFINGKSLLYNYVLSTVRISAQANSGFLVFEYSLVVITTKCSNILWYMYDKESVKLLQCLH